MPAPWQALTRQAWPAASLILAVSAVAVAAWWYGDPMILRSVTEAFIYVTMVVGIYIFMGNSGVMTFGSIAFAAIGAYASAWQTCCPGMKAMLMTGLPDLLRYHTFPVSFAALSSAGLAAAVAAVVGLPIMRLSGIPASIGTLAFLAIVHSVYSNWGSVTLGTRSVVGLPLYVDVWVALGCAVASIIVAFAYQRSRFGIALRATREDEVAARACGIRVATQRLIAWTLSAVFIGLGGVLYGHFVGVLTVSSFYLELTFITLAMLVVGGTRSLAGAVVGVLAVSAFIEILRRFESGVHIGFISFKAPSGLQEVGLGIIMLIVLIARPRGLTNGREASWPFWRNPGPLRDTRRPPAGLQAEVIKGAPAARASDVREP